MNDLKIEECINSYNMIYLKCLEILEHMVFYINDNYKVLKDIGIYGQNSVIYKYASRYN